MTMSITERHILKRLRALVASVPSDAPVDDLVRVMNTNQRVLKLVLDAQEPMNKQANCFKLAHNHLDQLDKFINQRKTENWSYKSVALSRN